MEIPQNLLSKYTLASSLLEKGLTRVNPCYEVASIFVKELNKTAGQEYITKSGKKAKTKTYTELMVLRDLKAISKDVHAMTAFLHDCENAKIPFRKYYCWKLK